MKLIHTLPFFVRTDSREEDLEMAELALRSLRISVDEGIVVYNQGCLSNEELRRWMQRLGHAPVILGDGSNAGIVRARQSCFEFIWQEYPDVGYISEIHIDMLFPPGWCEPLIRYLVRTGEPMVSPGIVTSSGELQPLRTFIQLPETSGKLIETLQQISRGDVMEGFVHPVVHHAATLREIGGYDPRFLPGKQGYEDDSLLLGMLYYMGTRTGWRPKCCLESWVYHATMAQRMSLSGRETDFSKNEEGLVHQYGAYGWKHLADIHGGSEEFRRLFVKYTPVHEEEAESMPEIDRQKRVWDQLWTQEVSYHWDSLSQTIYDKILGVIGEIRNKRILEAGSGTGKISLRLASEGAEVTLADYSEQAIYQSRNAFLKDHIPGTFVVSDIRNLQLPDQHFHLVWNAGVLEHFQMEDRIRMLKEMKRVTAPGGTILVLTPYAECLPYRAGKEAAEQLGTWMYGDEFPVSSLKEEFAASGIAMIQEESIGFLESLPFLDFIQGAQMVKHWLEQWYQGLSNEEKARIPGYLLVSIGSVEDGGAFATEEQITARSSCAVSRPAL
ncbi:class I SAM-dependent methyltransferase [Paenibacillus lactis]|uniref:class I SAM-dependent methyltransferase n=1 Tax=Paenibacillus lactis TaxID=228574 RepID=UPI002041FBE1|nr:class I SAM-dependent methyltransferase [Paenibacillus lactis]MCM3496404.1 class I SAM-dependent methyltransferase [Paenibacillus lactis]